MENTNGVEEQLEYIVTSIDSLSNAVNEFSETYNNKGSSGGFELIIVIVLICININIKKLTQAIRDKK